MLRVSENRLVVQKLPGMPSRPEKVDGIPPDLLHRRRAARRLLVDGRHERNAVELLRSLPEQGESLHFVVDGRFEPCDLIPVTRGLVKPSTIRNLVISTLGLNRDNVACIANGMDQGKIEAVTLICSHYFAKSEPQSFRFLCDEIHKRGGRVAGLRIHAKLMLMEISDGRCFTVEGSGNLRACSSIEQFVMTNDRELFEFHSRWMTELVERSETNGR